MRCTPIGILAAFILANFWLCAQDIAVDGITHQTVYTDVARFYVPELPGFTYSVNLDGRPVPSGVTNTVNAVDYHELEVIRTLTSSGTAEKRFVQFIVRSSERVNSEWGLPPWVPYPVIDSAAGEFAGAGLRLLSPTNYPAGMEVPVVAWVTNADGSTRRSNGRLATGEDSTIRIRRGSGSGFLRPGNIGERRPLPFHLHSLGDERSIAFDASASWIGVGGTLGTDVTWPAGSRIDVTSSVSQAVGGQLTIGAGSVIRCGPGVEFQVGGLITAVGTTEAPVVFAPVARELPWGGFVLRTNVARLSFDHTILWGGGAESNWFDLHPKSGSSHRHERPMIYLQNGARAGLRDAAILDSPGQATHGESSSFHATRTVIQRHLTAGQHNAGEVVLKDCAVVEFPRDGAPFTDTDNDALYLTGGAHELTDTVFGWCLDDGVDSGSGSSGNVVMNNCWLESCFHEGMAWSETRIPRVTNCVVLNCGQGIEAGFGKPDVVADHILSLGNLSGARFGDNYDWTYTGFLRVTNSFLLHNYRDIYGRTWTKNTWTNKLNRMDLRGNWLTAANPDFPGNQVWSPDADGWRLAAFLSLPADSKVGIAFARRTQVPAGLAELSAGIPVGLSRFATNRVAVSYRVETPDSLLTTGVLEFQAGETVRSLPSIRVPEGIALVRVTLSAPEQAELTQGDTLWLGALPSAGTLAVAGFGEQRVLVWSDATAVLESAGTPAGPWSAKTEVVAPFLIEPAGTTFYRLRLP